MPIHIKITFMRWNVNILFIRYIHCPLLISAPRIHSKWKPYWDRHHDLGKYWLIVQRIQKKNWWVISMRACAWNTGGSDETTDPWTQCRMTIGLYCCLQWWEISIICCHFLSLCQGWGNYSSCSEVLKETINCRIKWPRWPWYSSFNKDKYIQFCLNPMWSVLMNASITAKLGLNINNNASYLPRSTEKRCCMFTVLENYGILSQHWEMDLKNMSDGVIFYRNTFGLVMLCA